MVPSFNQEFVISIIRQICKTANINLEPSYNYQFLDIVHRPVSYLKQDFLGKLILSLSSH